MTLLALTALATIIGFVVMGVILLAFVGVLVSIVGPWPLVTFVLVSTVAYVFSKPPRAAQPKR